MSHPESDEQVGTSAGIGTLPSELASSINLKVAAGCHEWVVARPDNPQVETIADLLWGRLAPQVEILGPTPEEWAATGRRMSGFRDSN
jgi:hypothetical protein